MRSVYQTRRGLDPLHLPDHAVRVDLLYGARAAEPRDLLFAQLPARGAEVVLQLLHATPLRAVEGSTLAPQDRKVARRGPAWYDRDDRDLEGGRCRHRT